MSNPHGSLHGVGVIGQVKITVIVGPNGIEALGMMGLSNVETEEW